MFSGKLSLSLYAYVDISFLDNGHSPQPPHTALGLVLSFCLEISCPACYYYYIIIIVCVCLCVCVCAC